MYLPAHETEPWKACDMPGTRYTEGVFVTRPTHLSMEEREAIREDTHIWLAGYMAKVRKRINQEKDGLQ